MPGRYVLLPALARAALALADEAMLAAAAAAAQQEAEGAALRVQSAVADHCRGLMTGDPAPVLAAADYFGAAGSVLDRGAGAGGRRGAGGPAGSICRGPAGAGGGGAAISVLGAGWDIQRAGARLRPFGIRPGRPAHSERPVSGWEALTPTEVKVAYLVADGRSNPDIAAELFLSRNTVQTHVSHILAKLGARSRVEIAAEALKHTSSSDRATA